MGLDEIALLKDKYSEFTELELHFYNMKYHGVYEEELSKGETRPVFYLYSDKDFFLISFMIAEIESPYKTDGKHMYYNGKRLDIRNIVATRLSNKLPYYYFRGPISLHPTLDDENILNTSFNPRCSGCDFCFYGYRNKHLKNIKATEGLKLVQIETQKESFDFLDEIAVVTGRFASEENLVNHITELLDYAPDNGFDGRLLYIGSQLTSEKFVSRILDKVGGSKNFKYVYTVERFFDRDKVMHGSKGQKKFRDIVKDIKNLKALGVEQLQYSYLVGIENLDKFKQGVEDLVEYATPHISIFRKTGLPENESSRAEDYVRMGAEYICEIRRHYEDLYGKKFIGNNFANLWPFPRSRFNLDHYLKRLGKPMRPNGTLIGE